MPIGRLNPDLEHPWFFYDPCGHPFEYFATEAEALQAAADAIPEHMDDGWSEEVCQIMVGRVSYECLRTNVRDRPDEADLDEDGWDADGINWLSDHLRDCDHVCDYEMKPLST